MDVCSMIGRKMLANIDLRLRDIFSSSEPFGNVLVVLVGDIRQLPPVFDTPLYAQGGRDLQLTGSLSLTLCLSNVSDLIRYSDNLELKNHFLEMRC